MTSILKVISWSRKTTPRFAVQAAGRRIGRKVPLKEASAKSKIILSLISHEPKFIHMAATSFRGGRIHFPKFCIIEDNRFWSLVMVSNKKYKKNRVEMIYN